MKKIICLVLCVCLVLSVSSLVFAKEYNDIKVTLNGKNIEFDQKPLMKDDRVLVPVRKIAESLGATLAYDEETETVLAVMNNTVIVMQIGSSTIYINGEEKVIDVPALEVGGRTLIPTRAFAEAFSCKVDWNDETETVIITK